MPRSSKKTQMLRSKLQVSILILIMVIFASLGAYYLLHSKAATTLPGDINGDSKVDYKDLGILASNYNKSGRTYAQGNLNNDPNGWVNVFDFAILAKNWGNTTTVNISNVPGTIDPTGVADVTKPLNTYLASVPNDTTIVFPVNGRYRIEGTLLLRSKTNITVDGNNSTFFASTNGLFAQPPSPCTLGGVTQCNPNRTRSQWDFQSMTNLLVHDVNTIGSATNPGPDGDYKVAYEAQQGFNIGSGNGIVLDHVTSKNAWGDAVYIGGGTSSITAQNVTVRNSVLDAVSRQCMSITDGNNVLIENNDIGMTKGCRRSMFDLEANVANDVIANLTIRNNDIGRSRFATLNSAGSAPAIEHDITFDGNRMHAKYVVDINAPSTGRRSNYRIINNTALGTPLNEGSIFFVNVDGIVVSGNTQSFATSWPSRSYLNPQAPVWYRCSTAVTVSGNNFTPRPAGMPESAGHAC